LALTLNGGAIKYFWSKKSALLANLAETSISDIPPVTHHINSFIRSLWEMVAVTVVVIAEAHTQGR